MIITIISLLAYIGCTILSYKNFHYEYSEGGVFVMLNPGISCLFFTFVPIFNIWPALDYLLGNCYEDNKKTHLNKFYKIKK